MSSLPTLNYTTPEEFVDYYYEKLKEDLGVYDIQISKVGFIGFLLNVLGYTHFDLKNYYDSLFVEAFIATAQSEESQYMQAAIYGYLPTFAVGSTAVGTIEFDFDNFLARKPSTVVKREVYLGFDSSKTKSSSIFKINGHQFIIDATYKFIEYNGIYTVEITTNDGEKITLPSNSANVIAPLYSSIQYLKKEVTFDIGQYNFGSHKTYYFNISEGYYLTDLEVYITPNGETTEVEYSVEYVKYFSKDSDAVVFLRKLTSSNFMIEFGSGIRGLWVSEGTCRLVIKYSEGKSGDLIDYSSAKVAVDGDLLTYDYTVDAGVLIPYSSSPTIVQVPLIDFEYSDGGTDPLSGDDLRQAIVNYIQTRDNLVSMQDFYNVAAAHGFLSDFKFIFKKINVYDNIFYLCKSFRDRNQEICYTTNHTEAIMNLTAPTGAVAAAAAGGSLSDDTYGYLVDAYDEWGRTIPCAEVTATTSGTDNSVKVDWSAVAGATHYRIYGRTPSGESMYWDVVAPIVTFTDDGTDGTACIPPTAASLSDLVYLPTFTINSKSFISAFLYKGNTRMKYYEGCILHELLRVNFSEITPDASVFGSSFEIPTLYLNLVYDEATRTTTIRLKSYQDIQPTGGADRIVPPGHTFYTTITIHSVTGISAELMTWVGAGTLAWTYEYTDVDDFGIFVEPIQIEIIGYEVTDDAPPVTYKRFTCRTDEFNHLQDISDCLKLLRYTSGGQDYLINVPVMYYDTYDSDENYYTDKMYSFINGSNFIENRMITDNIQVRFLNTYLIESPYIEAIFVQGKELISSYNWLDDVLDILDDAPVAFSIGDRYLVSTSGAGTFAGHDDEIAEYVTGPAWSFTAPETGDGVYDEDSGVSYVWTGAAWITMPSIQLPFQMTVTIKVDKTYVEANSVNLGTEKDDLLVALADYLQKEKTGTNIKYYNSQIIDFIHTSRYWVKSVSINVTDSSVSLYQLNNGLEVKDDDDILTALDNKLNIVRYVPPFISWDINNLNIILLV